MDQILDQARSIYEGEIDFAGQSLAERLSTILLSISGLLAFLTGYISQNIYHTLYVGLGGTALTFLVVVPPWPFFNSAPQNWLAAKTAKVGAGGGRGVGVPAGITVEVDGRRVQ